MNKFSIYTKDKVKLPQMVTNVYVKDGQMVVEYEDLNDLFIVIEKEWWWIRMWKLVKNYWKG